MSWDEIFTILEIVWNVLQKQMNTKYFRCSWKYVFLMYRKNPRKWNYWWNKFRSEDLQQHVLQVFSKKFANKVFLVSLRSTEQLVFGKTFYIDVSYIIITYPIFSNSCKKVSLHLSWKYPNWVQIFIFAGV